MYNITVHLPSIDRENHREELLIIHEKRTMYAMVGSGLPLLLLRVRQGASAEKEFNRNLRNLELVLTRVNALRHDLCRISPPGVLSCSHETNGHDNFIPRG